LYREKRKENGNGTVARHGAMKPGKRCSLPGAALGELLERSRMQSGVFSWSGAEKSVCPSRHAV
jgi:hypothetical protein